MTKLSKDENWYLNSSAAKPLAQSVALSETSNTAYATLCSSFENKGFLGHKCRELVEEGLYLSGATVKVRQVAKIDKHKHRGCGH